MCQNQSLQDYRFPHMYRMKLRNLMGISKSKISMSRRWTNSFILYLKIAAKSFWLKNKLVILIFLKIKIVLTHASMYIAYHLCSWHFSEKSLQQMSSHKRLKRKNNDGEDSDDEGEQSVAEAAQLMSLLHRYARENLLLANIYIKVTNLLNI